MMRLINGDCIAEMEKLIEENIKVDLILTDPPYGTTKCKWDAVIPFNEMWTCINALSEKTTPTLLFCDEPFASELRLSNIKNYKYEWIWIKEGPSNIFNAKKRPLKYHEKIVVFFEKQGKFYPDRIKIPRHSERVAQGKKSKNKIRAFDASSEVVGKGVKSGKYISDYNKYDPDWKNPSQHIYFPRVKSNSHERTGHPTQKPVRLMEHFLKTYTDEGDTVLDFTMGSGSTGVACKNLNRDFIGIELDEKYFNIAKERIK